MRTGHRIRLAVATCILIATPIWLVVAVLTGGPWIVPAIVCGWTSYHACRGFRDGMRRADVYGYRLRMQEQLAQDCARAQGGFVWLSDKTVSAVGFRQDAVTRLGR